MAGRLSRLAGAGALAAGVLLAGATGASTTGSLWRDRNDFYRNRKASAVGDIVTILIEEQALAGSQALTKTEAASDQSLSGDDGSGFLDFIDLFGAGVKTSDTFEGKGETSRSGSLRARMSASIVEVLSNGDFRVQGAREVIINQEKQRLTLTGTVRPEDIKANNTVLSTFLADARITYDGKGPVHDSQRRGLISRIISILF
jgi:flagellar L-ring protein precursor FlgH